MGIEICQRLVLKTPLSLDVILIITLALPHFVYGQWGGDTPHEIPWCNIALLWIHASHTHLLYLHIAASAWLLPYVWRKHFGGLTVAVFSFTIQALQLLQGIAATSWIWSNRENGICFDLGSLELLPFVAGIVMLGLGQALIRTSYTAIGRKGVYYGSKLSGDATSGVDKLQSCSFYSKLYKPHYVGTMLSAWAFVVTLWMQLPANAWFVTSFISLLYSVTSWMEDYL